MIGANRSDMTLANQSERTELAPNLYIWTKSIAVLHETGKGDKLLKLCVGERCDGGGKEPFLQSNAGPILITETGGDFACANDDAADELGVTLYELSALVRKAIPDLDWPNYAPVVGNWGEPIRATGAEAVRIAKEESSSDEPLWLCCFGEPDTWGCCTGIPFDLAPSMHAGHQDGLYLPIGRVGWCVVGSVHGADGTTADRIVEGPFQTSDEARCKLATWNNAGAKAGFAVDFFVALRHTPETFWQMVRRLDTERQQIKAKR